MPRLQRSPAGFDLGNFCRSTSRPARSRNLKTDLKKQADGHPARNLPDQALMTVIGDPVTAGRNRS